MGSRGLGLSRLEGSGRGGRKDPAKHLRTACSSWGIVKIMVPFLGPYYNTVPNTGPNFGDPKRDHNFDNSPVEKLAMLRF